MKRHLRWFIPLLLVPASYLAAGFGAYFVYTMASANGSVSLALLQVLLSSLTQILPLVSAVFAIVGGMQVYGRWRRSRGRLTRVEREASDREREFDQGWSAAQSLRRTLLDREVPQSIRVWEIVPNDGEQMFLEGRADYARYYGVDATYVHTSGAYLGSPAFVLAGVAASAVGNSARRRAAQAAATPQWREWQFTRIVATNQRIICNVGGSWLSFYYSAITALYPQLDKWTLVASFEGAEPLLLAGRDVPSLAVLAVLMGYGHDALEEHPALAALS